MYLWEKSQWPTFTWDEGSLAKRLAEVSREQGRLLGKMEVLGFELRSEANLHTLTEDVVKTSEIEGEMLERKQVRSSIARRLGMDTGGLVPTDRNVEGVVDMMLDATGKYAESLTEERLFAWHASLFPAGRSGMNRIRIGCWRDDGQGPMQVVSGPIGGERVHYEAPPADHLSDEMARYLCWLEKPGEIDPLLIAGLAHLWFVTIHPFDDGNGRIARAITDMVLARLEKTGQRFYSMSGQIRIEHKDYYDTLEWTQKGELDVTHWLEWFLNCLHRAIDGTQETLGAILVKARFWERFAKEPLNERQLKVLNRLLDGFEGKLTTSKWGKIVKCSQDTAYRDILDLINRGALQKDPGGGRSTSYSIITKYVM
ncbi:MAG: Fic family protein [Candidatus Thiodiazotropha sp. (ex Lucinoma kastoroae)]|nr:Fic family protein [Candidatus Thiodiazotropha sp. (ex Lucinoma kastoroae)]MCU7859904.1 Fic family protein [Candidatus Thiodiazotropha sp. (ex Lucinoma kastoroae)]